MNNNYRFLNPYNFVRYLSGGIEDGKPEVKLLGRCTPPPHDRYIGITGRMECELEAITPFFISDSEFVEDEGNEHKSYRFFRLRNETGAEEFAIPSTSLRGMLRSVFEAATNSCFSVFEKEKRLPYRDVQKARAMTPAIVQSLPSNDTSGTIEICESARVPFHLLKNDDWKCGDEAYAIVGQGRNPKVTQFSKKPNNGKKGWLKITGRTITNKKNEYFFYLKRQRAEFTRETMEDYNKILSKQIEDKFTTIYQTQILTVGDLIYAEIVNNKVVNIALVKVPLLFYQKSIGELLKVPHLHPCTDYTYLCPACRIFGWVHQNPPKELKKKVAYAGRIKISHAKIIENIGTLDPIPLAILSAPKPTTTGFYLLKNGNPDFYVTYDTPNAQLRGRKFYRHQTEAKEQEYKRAGNNVKDGQNRTIRDALKPGAKFGFLIEFENLAPVEFGALLWAIEMEDGMFQKLGLGKPLGFGSVKVSIKGIKILNVKERYSSFENNGWSEINDCGKVKWLNLFKDTMQNKYNKSFEELENIKDLKAILSSSTLPVHYPRTSEKPDPEGKNFEWFMQNKRSGTNPLAFAPKDKGFPLNFGSDSNRRDKRSH